jgi:Holliday junction resolvase-like predicted endonuclease
VYMGSIDEAKIRFKLSTAKRWPSTKDSLAQCTCRIELFVSQWNTSQSDVSGA